MTESAAFLSQVLTGIVLQEPSRLAELLRSANPSDLDPPYSAVIATLARMGAETASDPWALQQAVAAVVPGLPNNFIADLGTKGVPATFDYHLALFREGLSRRRLHAASSLVAQASRAEDLRMGIERVREALDDAEAVLAPQALPLLDGDLLWNYEAPAESVLLPGLLWRQSRAVLTGFEGSGKSVLMRQMAIGAALGLHPFKIGGRIDPIRTMILDLENPPAIAQTEMRAMLDTLKARRVVPHNASFEERFKFQLRTDGLDIVGRGRDREFVTRAVATHRPDLLCIGPVYRLAAAGGNMDEATAGQVLDYLNNLRANYDVAIVTEAHTAKGATDEVNPNNRRGLTPSGSAVWMRFPEVGRGLRYHERASSLLNRSVYHLEAWRGDRTRHMQFPRWVAKAVGGQVWFDDVTDEVEARL